MPAILELYRNGLMHTPCVSLASFAHCCVFEAHPCGCTEPCFVLFHDCAEFPIVRFQLCFPSSCSCTLSYLQFEAIEDNASLNLCGLVHMHVHIHPGVELLGNRVNVYVQLRRYHPRVFQSGLKIYIPASRVCIPVLLYLHRCFKVSTLFQIYVLYYFYLALRGDMQ